LRSLPREVILSEGKMRILMTHGRPASNVEALTPDTPDSRLAELLDLARERHQAPIDAVICGHSHQAFTRQVSGAWFINTGSVGLPDDGDPRARFAILSLGENLFQVNHYRVQYNVTRAVQAIQANGLPDAFAQMLIQGRDLISVTEPSRDAPAHKTDTAAAN
jgi:predicted phosphodiesterase